jgi:hypothetical protein
VKGSATSVAHNFELELVSVDIAVACCRASDLPPTGRTSRPRRIAVARHQCLPTPPVQIATVSTTATNRASFIDVSLACDVETGVPIRAHPDLRKFQHLILIFEPKRNKSIC